MRMFAEVVALRLQRFSVRSCRDEDGAIRFFVPAPGHLGRPTPRCALQRWHDEGAVRELLGIVNSIPELKRAVATKLICREAQLIAD